jgi:hypothetical protein
MTKKLTKIDDTKFIEVGSESVSWESSTADIFGQIREVSIHKSLGSCAELLITDETHIRLNINVEDEFNNIQLLSRQGESSSYQVDDFDSNTAILQIYKKDKDSRLSFTQDIYNQLHLYTHMDENLLNKLIVAIKEGGELSKTASISFNISAYEPNNEAYEIGIEVDSWTGRMPIDIKDIHIEFIDNYSYEKVCSSISETSIKHTKKAHDEIKVYKQKFTTYHAIVLILLMTIIIKIN